MNVARLVISLVLVSSAGFALAGSAPSAPRPGPAAVSFQGGKPFENKDFGYKIRPPKEWAQVPLQLDEKWQTGKWLSSKPYFHTEEGGGWTHEHKPELTVIAFVSEVVKKKATVEKKEGEKGESNVLILVRNPYKDYLDYLKRTFNEGGYYVSDEKHVELPDHKVTQYEIKVEKLASNGPKRIITWVHHTAEVDFAVEMILLEGAYDKLKKEIADTHKSFSLIPRTGAGLATGDSGERVVFEDESKLTPEKRKERRVGLERSAHVKAKAALPEGWDVFQVGRFLVLSHTDEKYARRVGEQAEGVMKWLETTFPFVGPEEYVRQPVLRICRDRDEESSFWKGGDFFFFGTAPAEIVTSNDQEGFVTGWAVERVNRSVLQLWFQERDRDLWSAMPGWIRNGLYQLIGTARVDKGKLEFRVDDWERDGVRDLVRNGTATKPRDLMKMASEAYVGGSYSSLAGRAKESGSLVRFLTAGPGAKNAKTRDVLREYIKTLRTVVTEIEKAEEAKKPEPSKKPKTEEEEEAAFKARNQEWQKMEQQLLDATWERCFRGWEDSDWKAFEKAYFDAIG